MEAIAAFSLACNILQVAQVGYQAASTFTQVYKNSTTDENFDIDTRTRHLSKALAQLDDSLRSQHNIEDAELLQLSRQCATVATSLNNKLAPFSHKPSRHRDRWRNGLKALRIKGEVENLALSLRKYQQTLDTKILIDLRSRIDIASLKHSKALASLDVDLQSFIRQQIVLQRDEHELTRAALSQQSDDISNKLELIKLSQAENASYQQLLSSLRFAGMNGRRNQIAVAHFRTFGWIFGKDKANDDEDPSYNSDNDDDDDKDDDTLVAAASDITPEENGTANVERNRSVTNFSSKTDRDEVSNSTDNDHFLEQTYDYDNFVEWLREHDDNYWITGKAGSGKSTLMSYVLNHELTLRHLKQWAAQQEIQIIDTYFWNSGSELQKSFKGMLATVILQLLEKADDTLRERFIHIPGIKKKVTIDDWSTGELERQIHALLSTSTSKFCIFFDGLDEVEIAQSESDDVVVSFIEIVSRLTNVKCCISSRPLQMFELAFQNCGRLRLEHLNYRDINRFFQDRLRSSTDKLGVSLSESDLEGLREEFNRKADGIFLWAHLALNSILQGLRHHDAVSQLHQRLEALPSELESLYEHMLSLSNKDSFLYRQEAAFFIRTVLLLSEYDCPAAYWLRPNLLQFTLCFDKRFALVASQEIEASTLVDACREMRTRILTRCAGLLEIKTTFGSDRKRSYEMLPLPRMLASERSKRVWLIHRTAKDFLLSSPAGQRAWADATGDDARLNNAFFQAMLREQSLSTEPVAEDWLRILFRDIHDRRHLWTDEALSDLVRGAEETVASSTARHLGSEKQNCFTRLSRQWADDKQCNNISEFAHLDILGHIMAHTEFAIVRSIVAQQTKRLTPEYCIYLLSSCAITYSGHHEDFLDICALLKDRLAGKQRLYVLRTCGHRGKTETCKALWCSVPDIICYRLLSVRSVTKYTEMLTAFARAADCDDPSLVAIAIDLDTGFCSYEWLPKSTHSTWERKLFVIVKLKSLHFLSCYAAFCKSASIDSSDLNARLGFENGLPTSPFDVEGFDKKVLDGTHIETPQGPFPTSTFRRTNKTDSQLIKEALLQGSSFPYLISREPDGSKFVAQNAALKELNSLIEPVAQRSKEVVYLDYMKEEGYLVDAEDTRIMREAPKMFLDEAEEYDAENVRDPEPSIVRRGTESSWRFDEFYDAET